MCTEGSGVHLVQRNWNLKKISSQKFGIYENTSYLCNVRTFVFDYPGRIPHGVRLYRYCPFLESRRSTIALYFCLYFIMKFLK